MYTSLRRYRVEPAQMDELMRRIDAGFARHIAVRPGFATYEAIDCGEELFTISAFVDAEEAEASRSLARDWVANALADLSVEVVEVLRGEVVVNRAAGGALKPAHAETSVERAEIRRLAAGDGETAAVLHAIDGELADPLAELPGLLSFRAIDCDGEIVLICLCEDTDRSAAASEIVSGYVADREAGSGLEERERIEGDLRVSRTRKRMLQEAHA